MPLRNFCRSAAELACKHLAERAAGLFYVVDDEHALAGGEAVGLEHVGSFERSKEGIAVGHGVFSHCEVARGWYAVAPHEVFGEIFRAFEGSAVGAGAYDEQFSSVCLCLCGESFAQTLHERVFVAGHHEVDVVLAYGCVDSLEVGGLNGE